MRPSDRLAALVLLISPVWLIGCSPISADRMNTFQLMTASAATSSTEDGGFLFLAAQMRFEIDKQVYPPVAKGGDSPDVLKSALGFTIGQKVGPALASDPVAMANVAKRLSQWNPSFAAGYDPGWKYQNALDAKAAAVIVTATKQQVLQPLQSKIKLAENAEYLRSAKELAAARETFETRMKRESEMAKGQPISKEMLDGIESARAKITAAAARMKEIELDVNPESRWHGQVGWKAEDYFKDKQVIALCRAIEANDVQEMERLIAVGADVNAVGKGGMTPLLWAFPDRRLERFECLLRHGANPNVIFESDFGVHNRPFDPVAGSLLIDHGCYAGESVTHLACRSPTIEYLQLVVAHGGDANLVDKETGAVPLHLVLQRELRDMKERVELLIEHKADLNHYVMGYYATPVMEAVQCGRYDVALLMIKAGADPGLYPPDGERKLIHTVLQEKRDLQYSTPEKTAEYQTLVNWLEQHGESLEQAQADEDHWAQMYKNAVDPASTGKVRQQIIAERKQQASNAIEKQP
jgi:ankyrin repeat protein